MGTYEMKKDEKKHQEVLERIKNFRLMDDDFMTKVFGDNLPIYHIERIVQEISK